MDFAPKVQMVEVSAAHAERRLDNFLMSILGHIPRSLIYRIVRTGQVRVNGSRAKPRQRLETGDWVRVPPLRQPDRQSREISSQRIADFESWVLYEDNYLIVVNKPSGIAVHGGTGIPSGLIDVARASRPGCAALSLVHRLDRETSGCLMLAKDLKTQRDIQTSLKNAQVHKRYLALLKGEIKQDSEILTFPLDDKARRHGERHVIVSNSGKPAESRLRVKQRSRLATLTEIDLITGRTHQIRVHSAHIHHPVAGDNRYGDKPFNQILRKMGLTRMFLHSHFLNIRYGDRKTIEIEAPLSDVLNAVLAKLSLAEY